MLLTRISKILAVFITVGSLAFVGFSIATTFGEPDPVLHLSDPVFDGYAVVKQVGGTQWEARRASDNGNVASSKIIYEVMVKVLSEVDQQNKQKITALQARQNQMQLRADEMTIFNKADEAAMKSYEELTRKLLAEIRAKEANVESQVANATAESQKREQSVARRREDVFRLKQQVEELKTDLYRYQEIEKQLINLQIQVEGDLQRAQDRNLQLHERLGY